MNARDRQSSAWHGYGTVTRPWAQRLGQTAEGSRDYARVFGNALHEELFARIEQAVRAGKLDEEIATNIGRFLEYGGYFGRLRPDIRLPLGKGREALWDLTTVGQAGHSQHYGTRDFVQYLMEFLYTGG